MCSNGAWNNNPATGTSWALEYGGAGFNFPEQNCVVCGKLASAWVGIQRTGEGLSDWKNADGSDVLEAFHDPPSNANSSCVALSRAGAHIGNILVDDKPCEELRPAVCGPSPKPRYTAAQLYFVTKQAATTWTGAREYCRSRGRDLVSVHNARELAEVESLLTGDQTAWIGQLLVDGTWENVDGTTSYAGSLSFQLGRFNNDGEREGPHGQGDDWNCPKAHDRCKHNGKPRMCANVHVQGVTNEVCDFNEAFVCGPTANVQWAGPVKVAETKTCYFGCTECAARCGSNLGVLPCPKDALARTTGQYSLANATSTVCSTDSGIKAQVKSMRMSSIGGSGSAAKCNDGEKPLINVGACPMPSGGYCYDVGMKSTSGNRRRRVSFWAKLAQALTPIANEKVVVCRDGNYKYPYKDDSSPYGNSAVMCKGKVTARENAERGTGINCAATSPLTTTRRGSTIVAFMDNGDKSTCYFDCTVCDTAYQFNDLMSSAQLGAVPASYQEARRQCQSVGRDLVSVHSAAEASIVRALVLDKLPANGERAAFIGQSDAVTEGKWMNVDNTQAFVAFSMGKGTANNCVEARAIESTLEDTEVIFQDIACNDKRHYVCGPRLREGTTTAESNALAVSKESCQPSCSLASGLPAQCSAAATTGNPVCNKVAHNGPWPVTVCEGGAYVYPWQATKSQPTNPYPGMVCTGRSTGGWGVHQAHGINCNAKDPLSATRNTQFMDRGSGYTCFFGCSVPTCGAQDVGADAHPWLEADLGAASAVQRVVAYHAAEAGLHINASYVIETSNTRAEGSWSTCADAARHHGAIQTTRCSAHARYVRMRLAEPGCFQLREFEVYTSACGTTGAAALTSIVAQTADNTTETGVGTITATRAFGGAHLALAFADISDGAQWLPFHRTVPDGRGGVVGNTWCGAPAEGMCKTLPTILSDGTVDTTGTGKTVQHCEHGNYQMASGDSSYVNDVVMCKGYASGIVLDDEGNPDAAQTAAVSLAKGVLCDAVDPFSATPTNMFAPTDSKEECYFGCSICPNAAFGSRCGPDHGHHRCTGGTTSADQMVFHSNMRKTFCDREGKCGNSPRFFEAEAGVRVNEQYDFEA
jgi:hypothetical protein